jgi:multicomponent K+:H+ antiporter subunit D
VLVASLFALVALARAGSTVFWKVGQERGEVAEVPRWRPLAGAGLGLLVAAIVALALLAGAAFEHADRVAGQLLDREGYIQAVLGEREGGGG